MPFLFYDIISGKVRLIESFHVQITNVFYYRFDDQRNHNLNQHLLRNVQGILTNDDKHIDILLIKCTKLYIVVLYLCL